MGFWLQQKLITLNDLERQYTSVSVMRIVPKRLRIELYGFRYKVALYYSVLQIKFDDKILWNPFEF